GGEHEQGDHAAKDDADDLEGAHGGLLTDGGRTSLPRACRRASVGGWPLRCIAAARGDRVIFHLPTGPPAPPCPTSTRNCFASAISCCTSVAGCSRISRARSSPWRSAGRCTTSPTARCTWVLWGWCSSRQRCCWCFTAAARPTGATASASCSCASG